MDFGHAISTFFKKSLSQVGELDAKLRSGKTSAKARSKNSKVKFFKIISVAVRIRHFAK